MNSGRNRSRSRTPSNVTRRETHRKRAYDALTRNAHSSRTSPAVRAATTTTNASDAYQLYIPRTSSSLEQLPLPQPLFLSPKPSNASGYRSPSVRSNESASSRRPLVPRSGANASTPSSPVLKFMKETQRAFTHPVDLILGTQPAEEREEAGLDYQGRVERNARIRAKLERELEILEQEERDEIEQKEEEARVVTANAIEIYEDWSAVKWDRMILEHCMNEAAIFDRIRSRERARAEVNATTSGSAETSSSVAWSVPGGSGSPALSSSSSPSSTSSLACFDSESPRLPFNCSPSQPFVDRTNTVSPREFVRHELRGLRLEESKRLVPHMDHLVIVGGKEGSGVIYDTRDYNSPL